MKNTLIAVCALLAMAATAGADTYYNGPYDEGAGTNVINSFVELSSPTFIGRLSPGITNSVLVTSAGTLEQTDKLYVGYSNVADGTTGLLKVQGTMTSASGTAIFGWGAGGVGTLEIDGGNVTMAALSTGRDGSTGVVTINGGSLTVNGATFGYGREGNTNTMVTQTGGAVDINGDVRTICRWPRATSTSPACSRAGRSRTTAAPCKPSTPPFPSRPPWVCWVLGWLG